MTILERIELILWEQGVEFPDQLAEVLTTKLGFIQETRLLPDSEGGETSGYMKPQTRQQRWATRWEAC